MLKFLADENFGSAILRGLLRRNAIIDIVRVQDHGLSNTEDPLILEWAAQNDRVVLSHDLRTMPDFAYQRVAN
jgi:predicted nuclease of predicted toxin-antitoxin system